MSATLDVNLLLYASDAESKRHERARTFLLDLVAGPQLVVVFWPTLMSYIRIATHPSIFARPLTPAVAMGNVQALLDAPTVSVAAEGVRFWETFTSIAIDADARGNLVPDAQLVALMRQHGVRTIWTHDRDFRRFLGIDVRDPFS